MTAVDDLATTSPRSDPSDDVSSAASSGSRLVDRTIAAGGELRSVRVPSGRVVVVAPHPDDEALAAGGLISHQRGHGREVLVIAVTDGEAAYPDWRGAPLAHVRRREQLAALEVLGVDRGSVHRLGIPDGAVDEHADDVVAALLDVLCEDDTIVAPATYDWHPDHEACGRAASVASDAIGCASLGSLFWAHHHPDRAPAAVSLGVLALDEAEAARRRRAVRAHRSQLSPSANTGAGPILPAPLLELLDEPVEYYALSTPHSSVEHIRRAPPSSGDA